MALTACLLKFGSYPPAKDPAKPTPQEVAAVKAAADAAKDQSYVLAVMGPEKLAHAMFPLGATESTWTKSLLKRPAPNIERLPVVRVQMCTGFSGPSSR